MKLNSANKDLEVGQVTLDWLFKLNFRRINMYNKKYRIEKIEQFRDRKKLEKFCVEIKDEIIDSINITI